MLSQRFPSDDPNPEGQALFLGVQTRFYVVFVAEGTFYDFARFGRLVFFAPTEFDVSRWAEYAA